MHWAWGAAVQASTDPAVQKGMKWLMQQIESEYSKLNVRVEQEAKKMVRSTGRHPSTARRTRCCNRDVMYQGV